MIGNDDTLRHSLKGRINIIKIPGSIQAAGIICQKAAGADIPRLGNLGQLHGAQHILADSLIPYIYNGISFNCLNGLNYILLGRLGLLPDAVAARTCLFYFFLDSSLLIRQLQGTLARCHCRHINHVALASIQIHAKTNRSRTAIHSSKSCLAAGTNAQ